MRYRNSTCCHAQVAIGKVKGFMVYVHGIDAHLPKITASMQDNRFWYCLATVSVLEHA